MFTTILLPVDPDASPEQALEAAIDFSDLHQGRIIALSVAAPRLFHSTEAIAARDGAAAETANRAAALECLAKVAAAAAARNVPCETVIAQSHVPSDEIIDAAKRYQCDVIFMATRGRMGVMDTVFRESETQNLLRKTPIPVLVFPRLNEA